QASEEDGLVPVHPAAEGLRRGRVREWVQAAVKFAGNAIEGLPAELRARRGLASVADALHAVHLPESQADVKAARERLAFEELFLHQSLLATRRSRRASRPAPRFGDPGDGVRRWLEALPFEPTGDQRRAF